LLCGKSGFFSRRKNGTLPGIPTGETLYETPKPPSYRQHQPSGQAVVTLNGHDNYLGVFDSPESRAEYDRLIAEWLSAGRQLPSRALSVNELLLAYLRFAAEYYAPPSTKLDHVDPGVAGSNPVGLAQEAQPFGLAFCLLRLTMATDVANLAAPGAPSAVNGRNHLAHSQERS
jgi:hypothetical protein